MNQEFFDALAALEKENGIASDLLIEKIEQGVMKAIKREYPDVENVRVRIDPETGKFDMALIKNVVDDEPLDDNEIHIDQARTYNPRAMVGDVVDVPLSPAVFGRVAAQSAKQSIRHDIRDFERSQLLKKYEGKEHEALTARVVRVDPANGNATLLTDGTEVLLFKNEQIPGETLDEGDIVQIYVVAIVNPEKKPTIKVSRTHKDLVKRLFEKEIPEIYEGIVEVKSISREAGSRTKIAVYSQDEAVDAVGACIGPRRSRISKIVEELKGEKIDIIPFSESDAEFIAAALAPAEVKSVTLAEDGLRSCTVVVPNNQLSLAIGNKGQNAKLAARLTGYKIDIRPEIVADASPTAEPEAEPLETAVETDHSVGE